MSNDEAILLINRERMHVHAGPSMNFKRVEWVVSRKSSGSDRGIGNTPAAAVIDLFAIETMEQNDDLDELL